MKVYLTDIISENRRVYGRTEAKERISALMRAAESLGVEFRLDGKPVSWSALISPDNEDYWRAEKVTLHGLEEHPDLLGDASLEHFDGREVAFYHLQSDTPGQVVNLGSPVDDFL